jgi:hypothetical protein
MTGSGSSEVTGAIGKNPDRFRARRTLAVDLARRDIGQDRFQNGAQQRERIALFGVDKFDCAHGWQPGPFGTEQNGTAPSAWRRCQGQSRAHGRRSVSTDIRNWTLSTLVPYGPSLLTWSVEPRPPLNPIKS